MRRVALVLVLCASLAYAESVKTIFNPFTGKMDFITTLSSSTLPSGSTQYIQSTSVLQSGATYYVSSGTVSGQLSVTKIKFPDGTVQVTSPTVSAGGGSASSLQTTVSGVQITSPTASLNFYTSDFLGAAAGTTAQIFLNPSSTDYIRNASSLQSGATFYLSSGTVSTLNVTSIQWPDGTVQITSPTASGSSGGPTLVATQTWSGINTWTTPKQSSFTYGLAAGSITTSGLGNVISDNGTSRNTAGSLMSFYKSNSAVNDLLFTVGSNQIADLFVIRDSKPISFASFGIKAGDLQIGQAGVTEIISTDQDSTQEINLWNAGELDIQSGASDKDIVLFPQATKTLTVSSKTGVTVVSSMTISGTGISVSTVTFTPSSTFSTLGTPANGVMLYCSDCTVTTPASCSTNSLASCVCAGSGSGAIAKRLNGNWYCN